MRLAPARKRSGLTLIEVLLALAIFLMSFVALGQLMNITSQMALDIDHTHRANQLMQKQMNAVVSGYVPLSGQSDTPFDEDQNWYWSVDAQADSTPNLWHVTVTVSHKTSSGDTDFKRSLYQMVLDPTARGSASIPAVNNPNTQSNGGSSP
ncbi:MAG TPA: prepilin-type N-terminal cleavage/methylation domain-containing protein [Gemmataceae bacterium]|jgi:type II secretion system protein I|nr:prepilin-type N-terminal cleavage/methylation domain-containing protein [Gemmataceae bacterium]